MSYIDVNHIFDWHFGQVFNLQQFLHLYFIVFIFLLGTYFSSPCFHFVLQTCLPGCLSDRKRNRDYTRLIMRVFGVRTSVPWIRRDSVSVTCASSRFPSRPERGRCKQQHWLPIIGSIFKDLVKSELPLSTFN